MVTKVELYDAFGELIYALAKADGVIQGEEITALEDIVKDHPWASEITWSFKYEKRNDKPLSEVYDKALMICQEYGACPDYPFLFEVLDKIAAAAEGVHDKEQKVIDNFKKELMEKFMNDAEN
jgi:hypothetical protein